MLMYAHTHVHTHACTHAHVHTHARMNTRRQTRTCSRTRTNMYGQERGVEHSDCLEKHRLVERAQRALDLMPRDIETVDIAPELSYDQSVPRTSCNEKCYRCRKY